MTPAGGPSPEANLLPAPGSTDAAIRAEITRINLVRSLWIVVTSTAFNVLLLGINLANSVSSPVAIVQWIDLAITVFIVTGLWLAHVGRIKAPWDARLVMVFAALFVLMADAYYFVALGDFGRTAVYLFGVLTPGVLLLLRPRIFVPFLLANHVLYCVLLYVVTPLDPRTFYSALAGGSVAVLLACLANYFLYRSKHAELQRTSQLNRTIKELSDRSDEMNELMAITAHDLRTPLDSLKQLCEIERERPEWRQAPYESLLDATIDNCSGMLALVNRVLAAHEAEHACETIERHELDAVALFTAAIERAAGAAARKSIRIVPTLPAGPAIVLGDSAQLATVVDNLLSNAIKYCPTGSTVEVHLAAKSDGWVGEIRDDGPGIGPGERAGLFRKFQKGANLPTAGEPSSGLGLFIARKTMLSMGGSLDFVPGQPRGATFRLRFAE